MIINIHLFLIELHILIGRLISKHTFLNSRTENQDNASIPELFFCIILILEMRPKQSRGHHPLVYILYSFGCLSFHGPFALSFLKKIITPI